MPTTRVFSPSVFDSYANLQNFFMSSDAIGRVLSRKDKPFSKILAPLNPNLACKWQVCQIATTPFRWTLALVLTIVAKIASASGAAQFAKQAKTASQYQWAGFNVYSETPTKLFRIKTSVNRPNAEGKIICNTSSIPQDRITDLRVWNKTFCILDKEVKFKHPKGLCRGMSQWFLYLYLNTKNQFSDPRAHMAALGRQFAKGGGMDAALLQTVYLGKGKLLNMKLGTQNSHSPYPTASLHEYKGAGAWSSSKAQIVHDLQNLPTGAYKIIIPRHATAYVKINESLGYFFDPNDGITEINGSTVGEELYKLISPGTPESPSWDVNIIPVSLRTYQV